ncbi:hypothetical protein [Gemmobacter serpentinus]|uniref:hypothetical protein n=1 Tax=Gemmobacter serpentinus TaxID=2652247 RepID=UPI00124EA93F|nr:hypothetical protein [Gemmobacter serpentinus]
MTMRALTVLAALILPAILATGVQADEAAPLSGDAFDALTRGTVMDHYYEHGGLYGAEEYLPGRRVIWRDGEGCMRGHWTETSPGLLCFRYDGTSATWCWNYVPRADGGLDALLDGEVGENPITLRRGHGPLSCDDAPNA